MEGVPPPTPTTPRDADIAAWRSARARARSMLVALDFDGTLAPIVAHADDAAPTPAARAAVERLATRDDTTVAIISGRALEDAARRIPVAGVTYAGNHGLEIRGPGLTHVHPEAAAARGVLVRCRDAIAGPLAALPGAWVEDKGLTLSVHYRNTPEALHDDVRALVRDAAGARPGLRVTHGSRVAEVRPGVDWDKGRALRWLVDALSVPGGAPIVYIGDDATDEDAFRALDGRGDGILVGPPRATAARYRVEAPDDVAALLTRLAE